jgi:hypothetical protein
MNVLLIMAGTILWGFVAAMIFAFACIGLHSLGVI